PSGSRARVTAGRLAHAPAERRAEGTRGSVADAFGDFGNTDILSSKEIFRDRHSPGEKVLHRRNADSPREAFEECRTRQGAGSRERRDGPRTCELVLHLTNRRS